jgi:hypothetical protein
MTNTLTSKQWDEVEKRVEEYAEDTVKFIDIKACSKGEIHPSYDGYYEQREYIGNYYTMESQIEDIINEVLEEAEENGEEVDHIEYTKYIEGFHDLIINFQNMASNKLPEEWFVYSEDGDVWVARAWESLEEIDEDIQHLVNQ